MENKKTVRSVKQDTQNRFRIRKEAIFQFCIMLVMLSMPLIAHASVESTLAAFQGKLINTILPLVGVLGVVWAGLSFAVGNANARTHLILAIFGAAIGFGAPSIIAFVRSFVQ